MPFFLIIHRMFFCALTDFGHWQNLAMHEDRWLSLRTLWLFHEWHPQKWIKWLWTGMLYVYFLSVGLWSFYKQDSKLLARICKNLTLCKETFVSWEFIFEIKFSLSKFSSIFLNIKNIVRYIWKLTNLESCSEKLNNPFDTIMNVHNWVN